MKKKHLLLSYVMLMLTIFTTHAQDPAINAHAVKNIPFGQKLPLPDITNHPDKFLPQMTYPQANASFGPGMSLHNANAVKRNPGYFKQLLLDRRKTQNSLFQNVTADTKSENENDSNTGSDFHLVKDINALADGNPKNITMTNFDIHDYLSDNNSVPYAFLDSLVYFIADDGIHGTELWRSNGTDGGTYMVKDITPGPASTTLYNISALNGKIYFDAYTASYGYEPWVSDGTESGTKLLIDIWPGYGSSFPTEFFANGKDVYFIALASTFWDAIWKTDGTTAGTKQVISIGARGDGGEQILQPTLVNGILFFAFLNYDTYGWDLWRSDGTDSGTYDIKAFYPDYTYVPAQFTSYNNKLYFSADDGTGRKLWVSDGTDSGTILATGSHDVLIDADYLGTSFPIRNHVLLIPGSETGKGHGLYKYGASDTAGLVRIKYFAPIGDTAFIVPSEMQLVNNTLYFKVVNYNGGIHDELWSSKGAQTSTHLVQKFLPGETINNIYDGSGICYFVKYDTLFGTELWRIADTSFSTSTVLVSDIFKGPTGSHPAYLTAFRRKLIFGAVDEKKGAELFMTKGDGSSVSLVKDINTVSTSSSNAGSNAIFDYGFNGMTALGKQVLFNAYERVHGNELYESDGTAAGTKLLNDVIPGEAGFTAYEFLTKKNAVYFLGASDSGYSIYKTNGTKQSLRKMTFNYPYISDFKVSDNGLVFYVVFNYNTFNYELWRTDENAGDTILLSSTLYSLDYLNVLGETALFVAGDSLHGYELWKSDGSIAGTRMVKDINPGISDSYPGGLFIYKNEVYFAAVDGTNSNPSFWKSDGTETGTIKLKDIDPWWDGNVAATANFFCVSNNILYFSAVNHSNQEGTKLWRTDGTTTGTRPIKDIDPTNGNIVIGPYLLTDVNGTFYFTADDGVHGRELWKSDGHYEGTKMVKDITPGANGSGIYGLTAFAEKLFFMNNGVLWSSDGTEEGTAPIDDPNISGVQFSNMFSTGDKLFLSGSNQKYGAELYVGEVNDQSGKFMMSRVANEKTTIANGVPFNTVLYPNPALANATLQITGNTQNVNISITDLSGKRLWQTNSSNAMFVNLPIEKFAAGTYFVTVITDIGSKTIKFVKQ